MKRANTYKGELGWQSEFDHKYACWANNHNGWAKAKKLNKRVAKRRQKHRLRKALQEGLDCEVEIVHSISNEQDELKI